MKITTRTGKDYPDGRMVEYLELVITGDKHTFSIRRYPRNTTVQMYVNQDKKSTKISFKFPNDVFDVTIHSRGMMEHFGVYLPSDVFAEIEKRWNDLVCVCRF